MMFYILSHLCSIRRGLACYSISYQGLAVSAEPSHAILYLITPWQCPPRLGMLFYIISRPCSILRGLAFCSTSYPGLAVSAEGSSPENPSYDSSKRQNKTPSRTPGPGLRKPELQKPELQKLKFNKQRHAGM